MNLTRREVALRVRGGGIVVLASGVMSTTRAHEHGRPAGQQRLFAGEGVSLQLHCQARQTGPLPGMGVSLDVQCTQEGTRRPSLQVPQAFVGMSSFNGSTDDVFVAGRVCLPWATASSMRESISMGDVPCCVGVGRAAMGAVFGTVGQPAREIACDAATSLSRSGEGDWGALGVSAGRAVPSADLGERRVAGGDRLMYQAHVRRLRYSNSHGWAALGRAYNRHRRAGAYVMCVR